MLVHRRAMRNWICHLTDPSDFSIIQPMRWSSFTWYILLMASAVLLACPDQTSKTGTGTSADAGLPGLLQLKVTKDSDHFLFTYLLADGSFLTVEKVDEVPEAARGQVIVTDTQLSPEQRQSTKILYIADLNEAREDGTYPCRPVSRFKFERDLLREPGQSSTALPEQCQQLAPSPQDRILLYSASWCGVCKTAAQFLRQQAIPFEEKDIEKDPVAQVELSCKALKSGKRINGVPVIDIAGTLLLGFDRDDILRLSKKLKPKKNG